MTTPPPPRKQGPTLPGFRTPTDSRTLWFSRSGCVVWHAGGRRDVLVGGALVGTFEKGDTTTRNLLLVLLSPEPKVVLEDLARAFGVTSETLRLVRRAFESGGYEAVVKKKRGGRAPWKVTPRVKKKVEDCFAQGLDVPQATRKLEGLLSANTVRAMHRTWKAGRTQGAEPSRQAELLREVQPIVTVDAAPVFTAEPPKELPTQTQMNALQAPAVTAKESRPSEGAGTLVAKKKESGYSVRAPILDEGEAMDGRTLTVPGPVSHRRVQFLGAWLLVGMTARLGLHSAVTTHARKGAGGALRLAVDAVTIALGVGEACVEGVRRLAHRSAGALFLAVRAPSPAWVRTVLGAAAAKGHGFFIQAKVSGGLMRDAARRSGELAVFYVDNHLRPYTGILRLLRGWRMQDKRARPGTTDFHVHDASGRPLYRVATLMHDSLGKLLLPIGALLRVALGPAQRILLAFDRAASYADVLAELRDANFEFVAYEKKPYRVLPQKSFQRSFVLDGERIRYHESRKNLGDGRGRLRRIALRMRGGYQVNLLSDSTASAPELAAIMARRWGQENAFKHGVERWGINQLDGRTFTSFADDAVIPSPLRRRLENSLAVLRESEGQLRRKLARVADPRVRAALEEELARNLGRQKKLETRRPSLPTHCTVEEAGLSGKLMHHNDEYKALVDTVRTACINAEADLAAELAAAMPRPREAKRLLQNLFSAPGDIRVAGDHIAVFLDVAAKADERPAITRLCRIATAWKLTLPGDPMARPLRFKAQK
jgi:hypothetical protein